MFYLRFMLFPTCKKNWFKKISRGVDIFFPHCNSKKPIDIHFFLISFRVICYFKFFFLEIFKSAPSLTG